MEIIAICRLKKTQAVVFRKAEGPTQFAIQVKASHSLFTIALKLGIVRKSKPSMEERPCAHLIGDKEASKQRRDSA